MKPMNKLKQTVIFLAVPVIFIGLFVDFFLLNQESGEILTEKEIEIMGYPKSNISYSLVETILDEEGVIGYYQVTNNSAFWIPVSIHIFYGNLEKYDSFEISDYLPIGRNEMLPVSVRHNLTEEELNELTEVRQYIVIQNRSSSNFTISGTILKGDMIGN